MKESDLELGWISGVILTPLRIIPQDKGDVLHGMKASDPGFSGFGEAYFSTVHQGEMKGWKRHREMTLNLVVPVGAIRFVIHDTRTDSPTHGQTQSITLSRSNYQRRNLAPMLWMGFQGIAEDLNLLLNLANIPHDPLESYRCDLSCFSF